VFFGGEKGHAGEETKADTKQGKRKAVRKEREDV
jgi:hypothetical protein